MTEPQIGSIQLDRTVESILVGTRHRADLGDIDALAASIDRDGLLQPLTITIDGVLVCGDAAMLHKSSIIGALNLYLDFINIFLYVVRLLGLNSRRRD